ncbi:MAG TPA: ATP-dependent DNA ligase [Candidatus Dormibacteraeota bacterium]|nr:ATP-dependent DNA ligase [Candidatus Dormibacteraeota bacterium]
MSFLKLEFVAGSVHLPELGLWLDAHEPETGPERVFVSHAHSDHTAAHREVILSAPTSRLMQARVPGERLEHVLEFGETREFTYAGKMFRIKLVPAGHIFGSAMALLEYAGRTLLYTGDFKMRRGLSAEPCEPVPADELIMETTYGRPQYLFPPTEQVLKGVVRFCRESLDNDETAVLLGYSLGKSQELLCSLGDAGLPLMLHGTVFRMTQIYEQFGHCFPRYERYESGTARGKVLLCPPNVVNSAMLRNLGRKRTAILTGWAVDPNCRFRYQCDAAFPLSDHADFNDLQELVKQVQPKRVYTLHGFAAEFADTLRRQGIDAQALSEDEQLGLGLVLNEHASAPHPLVRQKHSGGQAGALPIGGGEGERRVPEGLPAAGPTPQDAHSFRAFAEACAKIAVDSRKLEKIRIVADYLRSFQIAISPLVASTTQTITTDGQAVGLAATWFSGRPFAASQNKVLQMGWAVLRNALCEAGGIDEQMLHHIYLKHSDSGETAAEVLEHRQAQLTNAERPFGLSLAEVDELFQKLHTARGSLAKTPLLLRALLKASPLEAKYLVKILSGDLRIGLKEGLVEDAIAAAFAARSEEVRQANLLVGDIGEVAKLAAAGKLAEAKMVPFRPIKFMLASPEETAVAIWARMHEDAGKSASPAVADKAAEPAPQTAVWIEDKYDGVRCQLHKVGQKVALYSRDLKEITATFLELADAFRNLPQDFILDGEIVAMRGEEILPFAELQKRLGRRDGDLFMREEVPIKFICFDLLSLDAENWLNRPLRERREALEKLPQPPFLRLAQITQANSAEDIDAAFTAARARGNEGLMVKNPGSFYTPGRRGLAWLKLKKAFATLDCAVVGAEYGHGKRNKVLSDYTFAVRDDTTGELKTIGKAYSGLTDVEIEQLTAHFLSTATRQRGRYFEVEPDTVLEIAFDRIQPSDRHSSGLALRFPRIARIRTDKPISEIDTLETARKLANSLEKKVVG